MLELPVSLTKFDSMRRSDNRIQVGDGADSALLNEIETSLNIILPISYRQFLTTYGWAKIAHNYIYGCGVNVPNYVNVIYMNNIERNLAEPAMPGRLVAVMNDGSGNSYCIDTGGGDKLAMPIVFWDHEHPDGERQQPNAVAQSFEEWLGDLLSRSL
ncbi:MAG: SMI1/KNR4 family protein [Gemmataceae bacterium]|nr:SMI1/KNR4 family protein [Gemmataceae bacterium]